MSRVRPMVAAFALVCGLTVTSVERKRAKLRSERIYVILAGVVASGTPAEILSPAFAW
jgi:hypothetical protein